MRSVSHLSALEEDVTVSLEVVARSSGPETELGGETSVSSLATVHPLPRAATRGVPARLLAGELAQVPGGVTPVTGAQETLGRTVRAELTQTYTDSPAPGRTSDRCCPCTPPAGTPGSPRCTR